MQFVPGPATNALNYGIITFDLSRSLGFGSLVSCKGAELGPVLLLNINRKSHIESTMTSSHLSLSGIERSNSRSLTFQSLMHRKGAELGHMLLLKIYREAYI